MTFTAAVRSPIEGEVIGSAFLRILGYAFAEDGRDLEVSVHVDGKPERGVWGLPDYEAFKVGGERAYTGGFTAFVRLGPVPASAEQHTIEVRVTDGADTLVVEPRTFVFQRGGRAAAEPWAAGTFSNYRKFGRRFRDVTIKHGLAPDHDVIEIGHGAGRLTVPLTEYLSANATFRGYDVDPTATAFCQQNITARFANFTFHHVDTRNRIYNPLGTGSGATSRLPAESGSADLVQSWSLFTHFVTEDMMNYVEECARVLRPGGLFINSFFVLPDDLGEETMIGPAKGFRIDEHCYTTNLDKPEACTAFPVRSVKLALERAGLVLESIYRRDEPNSFEQDLILARKA